MAEYDFHEGDRVKMVAIDTRWSDYVDSLSRYLGVEGTLVCDPSFDDECNRYVLVRFDEFKESQGMLVHSNEWYVNCDWLEMIKAAPRGWTGKVACTSNGIDSFSGPKFFTTGKVYDVKGGLLFDDTTTPYSLRRFKNLNELIDYMDQIGERKFIEFKGFANE